MAKNIRDLIRSININDQNLSHISNTGLINGSLLLDIEKIINEHSLELLLQIEDLERQNAVYREALEDIVTPIAHLRKGLKDGEQLNGHYAVQLAKDPAFLKQIAEQALSPKDNGNK